MKRELSFSKIVSSALAIAIMATPATAVTINLVDFDVTQNDNTVVAQSIMSGYHAGVINQALFRRVADSDDDSAGSGNFRDLFRMQAPSAASSEQGYNRVVDGMDSDVPNGFNEVIQISDLLTDNSGLFHVFAIDVNEPGNASDRFISLDKFQLYVGGPTDVNPLPSSEANLADLGTLVYDMDENEDSSVLMDASLSSGSGKMDLFVFVSVDLFENLPEDSMVYLFTEFGSYTAASDHIDFSTDSGHEDIAVHGANPELVITTGVPGPSIPEPHSGILACLGGLLLCLRHGRTPIQ